MSRSAAGAVKADWYGRGQGCSPEAERASGERDFRDFKGFRPFRSYGTSFRSLLGEPLPGLVTALDVAPFTSAVATWAGVAEV
ncbi:hypothetical protein DWG14_06724 [Streptomyces griseorubiginosus]|uniref:Uncharacterized protein n=1 Tax=Streptomyces griseorubiginosus TaxID=67304 RepID=A0AAI8L3U6_9ACTN|nr:hypothetical protein DWG14_06724 [Streptomyces griseorubiginosus]